IVHVGRMNGIRSKHAIRKTATENSKPALANGIWQSRRVMHNHQMKLTGPASSLFEIQCPCSRPRQLSRAFGEGGRTVVLSDRAVRRLPGLGSGTEADGGGWQWWGGGGEPRFGSAPRKEERPAKKSRRWFPRLQAFASECRRAIPVPATDIFSAAEREQHRI